MPPPERSDRFSPLRPANDNAAPGTDTASALLLAAWLLVAIMVVVRGLCS